MQPHYSELHSAARAYAEAGIPVFPCVMGGKEPATKNGFYDATTDLEQIDLWWGSRDFNVAFCPEDAGLFIVDIDPGYDHDHVKNLPDTYNVRTPRGGWHFYFAGSGRSTSSKLAPHVDTRGIGGYCLLPPSATRDGSYRVENNAAYAEIPAWVSEALIAPDVAVKSAVEDLDLPGNIERAQKILLRYVAKEDVAIEGCGGDDRTYRLCCEMLDLGLSTEKAQELIEEIWNPHCVPSWSPGELEVKLQNASQFKQNEVGAYGIESAQDAFGEAIKKLTPQEKVSRFYFKDEDELDREPDTKWVIKDLISERSTVMMYGGSGSYKSFLALDICLSIATGKDTFGSKTEPGLVFYGALEGKAHLKKGRRAWRILKGVEGKIKNFFVGRAPMITVGGEVQEFVEEIMKRCQGRRPALIVIDTLSKAMAGMNENDAADANRFVLFCDSLVETFGCVVMSVHHCGNIADRARGSTAFFAGFDTVLEVQAHKSNKAVSVTVKKHKDAEERKEPWTFEGRITGPSLTFEPTTPTQHKLLTGDTKEITTKTVGGALKKLGAFGPDAAVTTSVLAAELTKTMENESIEDRAAAISRTGRVLNSEAKEALEAYCVKRGKTYLWHLQT